MSINPNNFFKSFPENTKRIMRNFLSCIAIGELVAATDCRIFSNYFSSIKDESYQKSYKQMELEERFHFKELKNVMKYFDDIPTALKDMFRGNLLHSPESVIEKMILMHGSFEPAAFSYMTLLSKFNFDNTPELKSINNVANIILKDEGNHMTIGFSAIEKLKTSEYFKSNHDELKQSLIRHNQYLASVPELTLGHHHELTQKIKSTFKRNTDAAFRRIFNE